MAASAAIPNHNFQIRSNSLPSSSHPLVTRVEEAIHRLTTSMSPSTSSQMCDGLQALGDLYDCIEELLVLPQNQQALAHPHQEQMMEAELEASVGLLELCSALRGTLISTKEHVQDLQSSFRRNNASGGNKVRSYIQLRKKAERDVMKSFASLKQRVANVKGCDPFLVDSLLMEAMKIALSLMHSIASFLSVSRPREKIIRWSLVSMVLQNKKFASEQELERGIAVESLTSTLKLSYKCLSDKLIDCGSVQKLQNQLETLEANIEALETGLECLFRRLIRNRVSLLNILSL